MSSVVSTRESRLSAAILEKNIFTIQDIAVREGLGSIHHTLRKKSWCLLYNIDFQNSESVNDREVEIERQVSLDVNRSFSFDICKNWSKAVRAKYLKDLSIVLMNVFPETNKFPHYVQGSHDIASVLLLVLGAEKSTQIMRSLVVTPLKGSVQADMEIATGLLQLVMNLLMEVNPSVYHHLNRHNSLSETVIDGKNSHTSIMFSLSWVISWFANNVTNFSSIARIFDFLLASHPLSIAYLSAALIDVNSASLLASDDSTDLYTAFTALPKFFENTDNVEVTISRALSIYRRLPPSVLFSRASKSLRGVLKSRWPELELWSSFANDTILSGDHVNFRQKARHYWSVFPKYFLGIEGDDVSPQLFDFRPMSSKEEIRKRVLITRGGVGLAVSLVLSCLFFTWSAISTSKKSLNK